MSLAELSVKRPIFITCIALIVIVLGTMSFLRLGVDLFPNVTFPVVVVTTPYPGAGVSEVENLVSRIVEEEMSTISGVKNLTSVNKEGVSTVVAEFTLETDVKYAEQQVRDRVSNAKPRLPDDIKEPVIQRVDPADQPVAILAVASDLPPAELYDLANDTLKPKFEQISQVGLVQIVGGRKREVRVELDRKALKSYELSVNGIAQRIASSGQNIPAGKVEDAKNEVVFRTLGEFTSIQDIEGSLVNFFGNDVPVTLGQVGKVTDTLEDEKSRVFNNGRKSIFLMVFRQSGANTVAVVNGVQKQIEKMNSEFKLTKTDAEIMMVRDGAKAIRANVADVEESIILGIILTIIVVFFFLGSARSTLITGLALPYSLIGACVLMHLAGFSINLMTLLALSLAVGLVIDDAIVVRENIFRYIEMGKNAFQAALQGTKEVSLPVIATTLTVLSVFGPIAFLDGVVGQFFREFGLTVCFAMIISLFDAFTMAPMLSAYYAGAMHGDGKSWWSRTEKRLTEPFNRFQNGLANFYERVLRKIIMPHPLLSLGAGLLFILGSFVALHFTSKTFLPAQDFGEFSVELDLRAGTSLPAMYAVAEKVDGIIRSNPEVESSVMLVGNSEGEANVTRYFVNLVPSKQRKMNTSQFKDNIREQLKEYSYANPRVKDIDGVGGGLRPFNVNIVGPNLEEVETYAKKIFEKLKHNVALKDPDISYRPGKPELQVVLDKRKAEQLGVSSVTVGQELRAQIEGVVPAKYRKEGKEYDIRLRLKDDQRNLKDGFKDTYVPNINQTLVRLSSVANAKDNEGPATIRRQDRARYVQISADIAPAGPGIGGVIAEINQMVSPTGEFPLPPGMSYRYQGQAENFEELRVNMLMAAVLGILFIFLVLSSLYESFITPFALMLVIPACCGAFYALCITGKSLDIFSMIGCIMLLGVAMKNSILLVDYGSELMRKGVDRTEAMIQAGKVRLRPILMTTFALIAGMFPIALGLNEASRQRTSMGVAIIGGLITSTLLSLIIVPAAFGYIDRFKVWIRNKLSNMVGYDPAAAAEAFPTEHAHDHLRQVK